MKKKKNIKPNKTKKTISKTTKNPTTKKDDKKIKKGSSQKTKKNPQKTENRGRPPKIFVYQKPQTKRDGPGRPKKTERVRLPEIPEKTENKVKDMIILIIFIISFLIFGFSVYINIQKKGLSENTAEANTGSGETAIHSGNTQLIVQDEKHIILGQIYTAIQQKAFNDMYTNIDQSLKKSTTFKTFFSASRLERFINNIDNQKITITIDTTDANTVKYTLSYSLNQTPYTEQREADFIQRNDQRKISKIMCISNGCSKGPFFNPKKYF